MDRFTIMSIESVSHVNPEWEFGDRIRKVRRAIAQLDQAEMAAALGVNRQVYAAWEAGRTKPTDIVAIAKRIAELWPGRVTSSWVLGVDDGSTPPTPPPSSPAVPFPRPRRSGVSRRQLRPVADVTEDRRQDDLVHAQADDAVDDSFVQLSEGSPFDSDAATRETCGSQYCERSAA